MTSLPFAGGVFVYSDLRSGRLSQKVHKFTQLFLDSRGTNPLSTAGMVTRDGHYVSFDLLRTSRASTTATEYSIFKEQEKRGKEDYSGRIANIAHMFFFYKGDLLT
jgi:hypothetical protein